MALFFHCGSGLDFISPDQGKQSVMQYEMLFDNCVKEIIIYCMSISAIKWRAVAHRWMQSAMGKCLAPVTL